LNRIDRLTAIIVHLQSRQFVAAEEISKRYSISLRTVYRDLKALEEAGVPIGVESGKGYFLVEGYHLPPVMFTREEASSFMVAEKILAQSTDHSIFGPFKSALTKIRAVLKIEEKKMAENLESCISVSTFPFTPSSSGFMIDILKAISDKLKISIVYHASHDDQVTTRLIDPIGVIYYGMDWHLIAFCNLRDDFRDFRISRIKELKISNLYNNGHDNYSLEAYYQCLSESIDLEQVRVCFDKSVIKDMGSQKYYHGLISEIETELGTEMIFASNSLDYIGKWLLTFMGKVEIISPPKLIEMMQNFAKEIQQKYLNY
jgi:predicted DNA-binding transcriptional regulator YafY